MPYILDKKTLYAGHLKQRNGLAPGNEVSDAQTITGIDNFYA